MDLSVTLAFSSAFAAGVMALTIAWYERRSFAHWSFVIGMVFLAVESVLSGRAAMAPLPEDLRYWQNWRLFCMSFLPAIWLLFSLSYARGNAREFLARWRLMLILAFLVPVTLASLFQESLLVVSHAGETGSPRMLGLSLPGFILNLCFLVTSVLVLMNLERTYRAAVGTLRWRIKFMILGLGVLFAARAYTCSQALLFHGLDPSLQPIDTGALILSCLLILRSVARSGHFDVQVYPSHAVLYRSFAVLLAGAYLLLVGLSAKVVDFFGGDASSTLKASIVLISLVFLVVLLLSENVRLHAGRFISRHFRRPLHDYQMVWRTFTEATARCVEKGDLSVALSRWVSEVFRALAVTVWLMDEKRQDLVFGASTSLSALDARRLQLDPADALQALPPLARHASPLDLDASKEVWAVILRRLQPGEFHQGANRVCLPLVAGGELLGLIILGDRVGGVPFDQQDLDLLKSVGHQAAASLLNLQQSQRLAQGKQLEAFQTMSTFFVHDLKNTASTLSLMLQNLPVHFNDPGFREDALRGISRTVTHINDLIGRLTSLRQEIAVRAVDSDLNALVQQALTCLKTAPFIELVKDLRPMPKIPLDPAQIQNVVTNLLLNARDALGSNGQIRVETSQSNGWAVFNISDNGCGMSPEFLEKSLFRPFQTTKKNGIGIGMFQCKVIVEAHRGRIEVESHAGKGTTFRVLLPSMAKVLADDAKAE